MRQLLGVEKGDHHITATLISSIFSNMSRGAAPLAKPFLGPILDCIGWVCFVQRYHLLFLNHLIQIAVPFWRRDCDSKIIKSKEEHQRYLARRD